MIGNPSTISSMCSMMQALEGIQSGILWLCSVDHSCQHYTSPKYDDFFRTPRHVLKNEPLAWMNDVAEEDQVLLRQSICQRKIQAGLRQDVQYRVRDAAGTWRTVLDTTLPLVDRSGQVALLCGYARLGDECRPDTVADRAWQEHLRSVLQQWLWQFGKFVLSAKPDSKISIRHQSIEVELTKREQVCAYHLMLGHSAKETAEKTFTSPRTVENHLATLKEKFYCSSKLQLLQILYQYCQTH